MPQIPAIANGQLLGAEYLNQFGRSLNWLLGWSHTAVTGSSVHFTRNTTSTSGHWGWRGWGLCVGDAMHYAIVLRNVWYATDTVAELRIHAGGSWVTATTVTHTGDTSTVYQGSVDISGLGLVEGEHYEVRWLFRTTNSDHQASFTHYWTSFQRDISGDWTTLTAFTERQSDAADFEQLRTNIELLRDQAPQINALFNHGWDTAPALDSWMVGGTRLEWSTWQTAVLRRQHRYLYVAGYWTAFGDHDWRVRVAHPVGTSLSVAYTSPSLFHFDNAKEFGTVIDLDAEGVPHGELFRANIQTRELSGWGLRVHRAWFINYSDQVPDAAWLVPTVFAHGDQTVTPDNLNRWITNANLLYDGAEALLGEARVVGYGARQPLQSQEGPQILSGTRQHRWLRYRCLGPGVTRPHLHWNFDTALDEPHVPEQLQALPYEQNEWITFDLSSVQELPRGARYCVDHVRVAYELRDL